MKRYFEKIINKLLKKVRPFSFYKMNSSGSEKFFKNYYNSFSFDAGNEVLRVRRQLKDADFNKGICLLNYSGTSYVMSLRPAEFIGFTAMKEGSWEYENIKTIDFFIGEKQEGIFIDVGANIGAITIPLAKKRPEITFICFEPNPDIFKELKSNISLNNLKNVIALPLLCGEQSDSKMDFYALNYDNGNNNMGMSSSNKLNDNLNYDLIQVSSIKIDDLIKDQFPQLPIIGMKIDVEGHEYSVLKGSYEIIKNHRPFLLCEFESYHHEDKSKAISELLNFYQNLDYAIYGANFYAFNFKPRVHLSTDFVGDYLALPNRNSYEN